MASAPPGKDWGAEVESWSFLLCQVLALSSLHYGKWMEAQVEGMWWAASTGYLSINTKVGRKAMTNLDSVLKSKDITVPTKTHIVKATVFLVVRYRWELNHKESWAPKNWCFQIVQLEKTLESSLDFKVIKPVNPKGNQPWIFIGRTDAKAETPIPGHLKKKKALMLGKIKGKQRRRQHRRKWLDSITDPVDMNLRKL